MPDYPKEQLLELYKELPKDLQEAIFSQDIGWNVQEICKKNNVGDEKTILEVIKNLGYLFLGILAPNEFLDVLKNDLKIEKNRAENIFAEISNAILKPYAKNLGALYGIEIKTDFKIKEAPAEPKETEKSQEPQKQDTYREPIN